MEFNEYQMAAERTARSEVEERERFINFVFGLTGEAGEVDTDLNIIVTDLANINIGSRSFI